LLAVKKRFIGLAIGVNLTNVLQAPFEHVDPKSAKDTGDLTAFCAFGIFLSKSCS